MPAQISGCDIPPKPTFKNVTVNAPDGEVIVARKGTLQSLRQVRRQFPLFQKAKSKWPDPDASVGKFCGMKGKFSCWEAKGPAQEAFNSLSKDIADLLERTCGPVPASSQVIYDIFMVGETPGTAAPQVMFSCRKSGPRKEAMETLKKSGILGNYPGIETGHWQFPPHILDPRLLAYGVEPDSRAQTPTGKILLVPLYTSSTMISSSASPQTISAMRLYTVDPSEMNGASHKATVGSLACFAGKNFYVSVSHALVKSGACDTEPLLGTAEDDDDSEFEFGGLIDGVEDFDSPDGEESELNDSGSMTSESSGSQDDFNHELTIDGSWESLSLVGSDTSLRIPTEVSYSHNTNSFKAKSPELSPPIANIAGNQQSSANFATIFLESADLDYALIEPSGEHNIMAALSSLPMISLGNISKIPPGETSILTVTGSSGLAYGILSGRPSYIRLLSSKTFQEAYTATIDGPLVPGDSGSVVLNAETREVYGHMVVGSTVSRIAYIIPASNVLKDLRLREEVISHTKIEVEAHSIQSADINEEVPPIPSELHLRPDSGDLPATVPSFESQLSNLRVGPEEDASPCTYEPSWCSDLESIFSENNSIASSNSSIGEFHSKALSEIVNLFLCSDLKNLYPQAITMLGPEKFQRNFRRFLLRYGRQLLREASNYLERQAAMLVRRSATQIAVEIRESITQDPGDSSRRQPNSAQLNEWLQSVKGQEDERDDDDLSDSSGSEDWETHDDASLDTLEEVKTFMVTGKAFLDLCETFQQWLKLREDPKGKASTLKSPEAAASLLSSTSAIRNDPSSFIKVEDGFIQTATALQRARFSYSDREDNLVGWHILKRYDLLSEVKNNKVTLTFFLQSRQKRTYKLEFKTKRKASFDVQLGSRWEDEGEELRENFTRLMRLNQTQVARNNAAAEVDPSAPMIPPDYVAGVLLALWNGSGNGLAKDRTFLEPQAVIAPPISMPIPIARPETGMWGKRQGSPTSDISEHGSNASISNFDLSDGSDYDYEDERDKCSRSSTPNNIDDEGRDPASYEDDFQPPLSSFLGRNLEEESYRNPWLDDT